MTLYEQILATVKAKFLKDGAFTNMFVVGRQEFLDLLDSLRSERIFFNLEESSARQGTDGVSVRFSPYGFAIQVFSSPTAGLREL